MKKWLLFAVAVLCAFAMDGMPFGKTDVGKLRPVQVLCVAVSASGVEFTTDTGDAGAGATVSEALENMKATSRGTIFLETAEFLLLMDGAESLIPELCDVLRPGCGVCKVAEMPDLGDAEAEARYILTKRKERIL